MPWDPHCLLGPAVHIDSKVLCLDALGKPLLWRACCGAAWSPCASVRYRGTGPVRPLSGTSGLVDAGRRGLIPYRATPGRARPRCGRNGGSGSICLEVLDSQISPEILGCEELLRSIACWLIDSAKQHVTWVGTGFKQIRVQNHWS